MKMLNKKNLMQVQGGIRYFSLIDLVSSFSIFKLMRVRTTPSSQITEVIQANQITQKAVLHDLLLELGGVGF